MMDVFDALAGLDAPGPTVTALSRSFWAAAERGELLIQRCGGCGKAVFYPRDICPHCWSDALSWQAASGRGRLKTWSVIEKPGHPAWAAVAPYAIGLVELAEGPTLLSHILGDHARLALWAPLSVRMTRVGRQTLPFFELAS